MEETLKIGGPLESVATDKKVADAIFIKDSAMSNKTQRQINSDLSAAIEAILLLIPSAASSLNKLADKAYVDSSVATSSATLMGTFNLVNDLHLTVSATHAQIGTALANAILSEDNNDFAYVQIPTSDAEPTEIAQTDRYKYNGTTWEYEYTLNNSGFTSDQWAAINSGITEALVTKLSALPTNSELTEALGVLTSSITTINQKIPETASQANKLVDIAAMESYIVQVLDVLTASFNVTSSDGHVTVQISQVDGKITSLALTTLDIASAASLSLVEGRVTTAEGNISTNSADIAILQDAYAALTQSALVIVKPTDTWPVANPEEQTIYRVVDRTNTPPQYYSDYMWNGTVMVLMATYDNAIDDVPIAGSNNLVKSGGVYNELALGAVYDVSAKNPTAGPNNDGKWESLSALLSDANLSTLIPTSVRKGGMSIKFVQSSDHNYVQYRYMGTDTTGNPNPFLNTANWQGVDTEPKAGSHNLVESEGVSAVIGNFNRNITLVSGTTINRTDSLLPLNIKAGEKFIVKISGDSAKVSKVGGLYVCDRNGGNSTSIKYNLLLNEKYEFTASSDIECLAIFIDGPLILSGQIISFNCISSLEYEIEELRENTTDITEDITDIRSDVHNIQNEVISLDDEINGASTEKQFSFEYDNSGVGYIELDRASGIKNGDVIKIKFSNLVNINTWTYVYLMDGNTTLSSGVRILTNDVILVASGNGYLNRLNFFRNGASGETSSGNAVISNETNPGLVAKFDEFNVISEDFSQASETVDTQKDYLFEVPYYNITKEDRISVNFSEITKPVWLYLLYASNGSIRQVSKYQIRNTGEYVFEGFLGDIVYGVRLFNQDSQSFDVAFTVHRLNLKERTQRQLSNLEGDDVPVYFRRPTVLAGGITSSDYLYNKSADAAEVIKNAVPNGDAFIFITDMHFNALSSKASPSVLKYIQENTNIPRLFNGGDNDDGQNPLVNRLLRKAMGSNKVYTANGNHEYIVGAKNGGVFFDNRMYNDDVVYGSSDEQYYYVDNHQQKMRYVVLAAFGEGDGRANNLIGDDFDEAQLTWFTTVALNAPSGYSIIVISHYLYSINMSTEAISINEGCERYVNAINAHNETSDEKVIVVLCGHAHRDRIINLSTVVSVFQSHERDNTTVPCIVTTCDKNLPYEPFDRDLTVERPTGTIREIAFDVVVINKTLKKITCVRIGCPAQNGIGGSTDRTLEENCGSLVEYREVLYP